MKQLSRWRQAWTIARIELRRAFFSKRAFWVYALALFPSLIFVVYHLEVKLSAMSLSAAGEITPAQLDSVVRNGEAIDAIIERLGKPARDVEWTNARRIREKGDETGVTAHAIEPAYDARFIRLSIFNGSYAGDGMARIYEFEVYGDGPENLALNRPATGSAPCGPNEGPEKAFNGSVSGGIEDRWCSQRGNVYLQVDLGAVVPVRRVVIRHASAGGEPEEFNTQTFSVRASTDNKNFATIVNSTGARLVDEITTHRRLTYFDGRREARLNFEDGKLASKTTEFLKDFEEDRRIFAGVFQFFYLRLAIFFGCLGIFMNLFRGEMLDKTLHYWFLAPARREVLLAGKYGAGLIASIVIFTGGALLCFGFMVWPHSSLEVQAFWRNAGMWHVFWYAAAAALGCVGYGSVFLAAGLFLRNPIIPAAILLAWESVNGFLPEFMQKASILYYLQSLCPVPAPLGQNAPGILQLLLTPASPASRSGAILGILAIAAAVLWLARRAILRMQISYSGES
ncbi:MAG: discoidin domain-containing protein [Acidobacteriota bacterium]|jgi:ABC-type transport system involved in multi-copper enzyme maturation permease subunit|nr:discoidin domain-containing protein [Acidobacteriota bacterium]